MELTGLNMAAQDYIRLQKVYMGYTELHGAKHYYMVLPRVKWVCTGLHKATQGYIRLHRVE